MHIWEERIIIIMGVEILTQLAVKQFNRTAGCEQKTSK